MASIIVSGRMAVLFDRVSLAVGDGDDAIVDGYQCRWCGWTYVVDDPKLIPDHECHGATAALAHARSQRAP